MNGPWQQLLDSLTRKAAVTGVLQNVKSTETNVKRVQLCYNEVRDELASWLQETVERTPVFSKDAELSQQYRAKGNKVYVGAEPSGALVLYTKAVLYAPAGSDELSLSYGNRSAALQLLGKHKECVEDVDRALELRTEDSCRRGRLKLRRAKSCMALGRVDEARVALDKARRLLRSADNKANLKTAKLVTLVEECAQELEAMVEGDSQQSDESSFRFISNDQLSSASEAINVETSKEKGRHVVATRDIQPGEILFFEKPFAFVCLPDRAHLHCHSCCRKTLNPVPCDECAAGSYCSEYCRDAGWKRFHRWECGGGIGLDLAYNVGIAHLGLRVALVGLTTRSGAVRRLLHHIDKIHPEDLYQYTLISTALVVYLERHTDIFAGPNRQRDLLDLGGTILLHVAQMVSNGHALVDYQSADEEGRSSVYAEREVRVGTGIYPAASMMNHSCDPNIINGFDNERLIVRAMKFIPKGAEVLNCYGPHFLRTPKRERSELLEAQYFFKCDCLPCRSPVDPLDRILGSQCRPGCGAAVPSGAPHCPRCQQPVSPTLQSDFDAADDLIQQAEKYLQLNKLEEATGSAEEALKRLTDHLHDDNRAVLECRNLLGRCWALRGRFKKSAFLLEECLSGAKWLYGSVSVEVAGEIVRLTDVVVKMMQSENPDRALFERAKRYANEGKTMLETFYGVRHPKYLDIVKNESLWQACGE